MEFWKAIIWLNDGYKVHRSAWPEGTLVEQRGAAGERAYYLVGSDEQWVPTQDDMMANDWILFRYD